MNNTLFYKDGSELIPVGTNQFAVLSPDLVVIEKKAPPPPPKVEVKTDNKKKKKSKWFVFS